VVRSVPPAGDASILPKSDVARGHVGNAISLNQHSKDPGEMKRKIAFAQQMRSVLRSCAGIGARPCSLADRNGMYGRWPNKTLGLAEELQGIG
jgi:hypothetical protein